MTTVTVEPTNFKSPLIVSSSETTQPLSPRLPELPYASQLASSNSTDSLRGQGHVSSPSLTQHQLNPRSSRRSLAAIARERTSNAFSNFINNSSNPNLRPAASSTSLSKPTRGPESPLSTPNEATVPGKTISDPRASIQTTRGDETFTSAPSSPRQPVHSAKASLSRPPSPLPETPKSLNFNPTKMHQTSSRLLRMTEDERPFTRDFKDLFSTLMVSLPLTAHRVRFSKVEQTFSSEEAINNLGSLKFSQSNRMPDPKDPSRIVTTTTTTTFSMAKEMARSVCQRFMEARFIEPADGRAIPMFPTKGAIWALTPKGMHVLHRFCQRNGINASHITPVLARDNMHLVILERDTQTDKLDQDRGTIEVIFRRFIGQEGPNVKSSTSTSDSESLSDYSTGLIGVKMAKERKIFDRVVTNSFTGKATTDWLMDCCTTIDRRETYAMAEMFIKHGLMWAVVEDKVYMHNNPGATIFQPTKNAIYALTDRGQRLCGWITRDKSDGSSETREIRTDLRGAPRDSNNNRLNHILQDPALRLLFREFLRFSLCEENLSFYVEIKEFTDTYHQQEKAKAFIRPDAVRDTLAAAYGMYSFSLEKLPD